MNRSLAWKVSLSMSALAASLLVHSIAQAAGCAKGGNTEGCYQNPGLKFALPAPTPMNADRLKAGPNFKPALTQAELQSGVVFCQYYFHEFSSPGSAKFMCAKTNAEGKLLNEDGEVVPEAAMVSTRNMKIKVKLNNQTVQLDEGYLLDANKKPLIHEKKSGEQKLVKADELKIKYFVDSNQYQEKGSGVKRQDIGIKFDGQNVNLPNAFMGPKDISNPRWNEVFAEVAGTRLFWALGLPADMMIPMNQLVCFGCETHPKDQKDIRPGHISVYNRVAIEKKMKGAKLAEQFSMNEIIGKNVSRWSAETVQGLEAAALASRLIGFSNVISLQTRLQCADKLHPDTNECSTPMAFVQDIGSSWAGPATEDEKKSLGGNPRGSLIHYQRETVFKTGGKACELLIPYGSDSSKEMKGSSLRLHTVSADGLAAFQKRIEVLTPDVIEALFELSHFDDMQPALRDKAPGSTLKDKQRAIIAQWSAAFQKRVDEIRNMRCPGQKAQFAK